MAPRNSSILVTARLRSFFERIGENPEDNEYEFLDEENATVHEINVIYRVVNTLRDGQWDHDVITSMLDGLTRAKARAAARAAAQHVVHEQDVAPDPGLIPDPDPGLIPDPDPDPDPGLIPDPDPGPDLALQCLHKVENVELGNIKQKIIF